MGVGIGPLTVALLALAIVEVLGLTVLGVRVIDRIRPD